VAAVRRFNRGRLVVVAVALAVTILPLVAFWRWAPDMNALVSHPTTTTLTPAESDSVRTALWFDFAYIAVYAAVLVLACSRITAGLVRYRWIGRWLACLAVAGAVADVAEDVLALRLLDDPARAFTARWLEYANNAKKGLLVMPAVFAFGALVAWATRISDRDAGADPRSVSEAIAWAKAQPEPRIFPRSVRQRSWLWLRGKRSDPIVPPPGTAAPSGLTGVCFSGGGIRSAAYNLGALQELQASGELLQADYLSAVSGGSYIAGAHAITGSCSPEHALGTQPPFAHGSAEEQYLRNRTTYLFPNLSGVAVALWRLVRGLLVNIAFVALVLFIVARPYGWAMAPQCRTHLAGPAGTVQVVPCSSAAADEAGAGAVTKVTFDTLPWALPLVVTLLALAFLLGLFDLLLRPREYAAPFLESWSIRTLGLAIVAGLFLLGLPWLAARILSDAAPTIGSAGSAPRWITGSAALSTLLTGLLALVRIAGPKGAAPGATGGVDVSGLWKKVVSGARRAGDGILRLLFIVVGGIIGPVAFLAGFLLLATSAMHDGIGPAELGGWLLLVSLFLFVQGVGDANRWSFQPFYKRRLQSAFTLKRTCAADGTPRAVAVDFGDPLPFMNLLDAPALVLGAAVNLEEYGLLPPGRPVSSFTFSRQWVDAGLLGAVPTRVFATLLGPQFRRDFTVPAAQAASGAAFSPVMGKMTKYAARFVFAILNLRLGVWLPNPARVLAWAQDQPDPPPPPEPDPGKVAAAQAALDAARAAEATAAARARAEFDAAAARIGGVAGASPQQKDELARLQADLQAEAMAARLHAERCRRELEGALHRPAAVGDGAPGAGTGTGSGSASAAFEGYPWLPRPTRLFRELFGVFRARSRFVYVSDGGHYENLGLVELLRRGCTWIYCFDAAGDSIDKFNTLADALAIARTELGVRVDIDPSPIVPLPGESMNRVLHVEGKVYYPGAEATPGHIVFAKLGITKDVPADVLSWRQSNPLFPTDGTADQLYTDQRFEAYRALGAFTAVGAIASMRELRDPGRVLGVPSPLRVGRPCVDVGAGGAGSGEG
jgi:hypothetical protein